MSDERQPDEPLPAIELEPLAGSPHGDGKDRADAGSHDDEIPIPDRPAHACPNCDYNLTGLTSRRCPECGEEFLLYEARWHAAEIGADGEELLRIQRQDKMLYIVGGACGLVGVLIPAIVQIVKAMRSPTPIPWISPPPCYLIPSVAFMLLLKVYFEWRWSSIVCIAGVCALLDGLAELL